MRFTFFLMLAPVCLLGQIRYSITSLVPNTPDIGSAVAGAINQQGQVAGSFYDPGFTALSALRYDHAGFTDLGAGPRGSFGGVSGINDHGQIAAYGGGHALRYSPGVGFLDLGTGPGTAAETGSINNSGQIAGTYTAANGLDFAYRFTDGVGFEQLGTLPGASGSAAYGINHAGWVTGTSGNRAFLYRDGVGMVDLGAGRGIGINEAGVVVGHNPSSQPILFMNGQTINLGVSGGAIGINNQNLVVGVFDTDSFMRGFVWSEQEGLQDLNTLIDPNSGWFIAAAGAVNDNGQIVGWGFSPERGTVPTPFLLNPVPEPSTWALLFLGAGAFALLRRRKA